MTRPAVIVCVEVRSVPPSTRSVNVTDVVLVRVNSMFTWCHAPFMQFVVSARAVTPNADTDRVPPACSKPNVGHEPPTPAAPLKHVRVGPAADRRISFEPKVLPGTR
jgi:hypothetical protein